MASIFTFDPDIPRVSSPWTRQLKELKAAHPGDEACESSPNDTLRGVSRLEAEPQEGPEEYKLHLLLRPRRTYTHIARVSHLDAGDAARIHTPISASAAKSNPDKAPSPLTQQSRQHRLEQLTTQLLWRLQQSSSHHTSSSSNVILPTLPDAQTELRPPRRVARLIKGLEESQGALYEIGVADDGTFVGLAEDEMAESLNNLRAMAACLGCEVEVTRMVQVGEAEWVNHRREDAQRSRLVVAEALVKPLLSNDVAGREEDAVTANGQDGHAADAHVGDAYANSKSQLRVTLAGATSSGKSSLLGTLTTSALDNARGKSRLAMLKHRHEITSGLTSSVSQELLGYDEAADGSVEVVNYALDNVATWADIHANTHSGRLVMVSDSAGHPRYRRTAVKGLIGWAPDWTVLCVPGNGDEGRGGAVSPNNGDHGDSLSLAYLRLCLRLKLPLVVAITKLDAASKQSLRAILDEVLTLLKADGRQPLMLPAMKMSVSEESNVVDAAAISRVTDCVSSATFEPSKTVPIVLTSAVQGMGIDLLHSLLYKLPRQVLSMEQSTDVPLFHVEDVYSKEGDVDLIIVSGHLRGGQVSVGDELYLGPFSNEVEDSEDSDTARHRRPSSAPTSRSFPGAVRYINVNARPGSAGQGLQWRKVKVASLRNLRLPVKTLHAGQVGTIAFASSPAETTLKADLWKSTGTTLSASRVRKGMVVLDQPGKAATYVTARFSREDLGVMAVGSQAVVYIASVRASARVISASVPESAPPSPVLGRSALSDAIEAAKHLSLDGNGPEAGRVTHEQLLVTLAFEGAKEYIEVGDKVLVMPGGGPTMFSTASDGGSASLEGFVGIITEIS